MTRFTTHLFVLVQKCINLGLGRKNNIKTDLANRVRCYGLNLFGSELGEVAADSCGKKLQRLFGFY